MAEEIGFENGRNSNFQGLVTLTLTLDPAIRHTVVHHSSTSTYTPNFIEIEETFCGRTDGRTDGRTFSPSNIIRSTFGSRPKKAKLLWIRNVTFKSEQKKRQIMPTWQAANLNRLNDTNVVPDKLWDDKEVGIGLISMKLWSFARDLWQLWQTSR